MGVGLGEPAPVRRRRVPRRRSRPPAAGGVPTRHLAPHTAPCSRCLRRSPAWERYPSSAQCRGRQAGAPPSPLTRTLTRLWTAGLPPGANRAVAQRAMRGVRPADVEHDADRGVGFRRRDEPFPIDFSDVGLFGEQESGAHPGGIGAEREHGGQPTAVGDTACRGALGHDHVHPGIDRSFRLARRGNRVQVQAFCVMDHVAQRSRIVPESRDDLDAFGKAGLDADDGHEQHMSHLGLVAGLDQPRGAVYVYSLGVLALVRTGCQVRDDVNPVDGVGQPVAGRQVGLPPVRRIVGTGPPAHDHDLVPGIPQHRHDLSAQGPGGAGYENPHLVLQRS